MIWVGEILSSGDEVGQGPGRGQIHVDVDPVGAHIQTAPEETGGHQGGADLVGAVRQTGGHYCGAGGLGLGLADFRFGQGQGKDDGVRGHGGDHFRPDQTGTGEADEDIGAFDDLGQVALDILGAHQAGDFALGPIHAHGAVDPAGRRAGRR